MQCFVRETWQLWFWAMFSYDQLQQRLNEWSLGKKQKEDWLISGITAKDLLLFQPNIRFIAQYLLLVLVFSLPLVVELGIYQQPLSWLLFLGVLLTAYSNGLFFLLLGLHTPLLFALVYFVNFKAYILLSNKALNLLPFLVEMPKGLAIGIIALGITLHLCIRLIRKEHLFWAGNILIVGSTISLLLGTWLSTQSWFFAIAVSGFTGLFLFLFREQLESYHHLGLVACAVLFGVVFGTLFSIYGWFGLIFCVTSSIAGIILFSLAFSLTTRINNLVAVGMISIVGLWMLMNFWFGTAIGLTFAATFGAMFCLTGMLILNKTFGWIFITALLVIFGVILGVINGFIAVNTLPLSIFLIFGFLLTVSLKPVKEGWLQLSILGTFISLSFGHLGLGSLLAIPLCLITHQPWIKKNRQTPCQPLEIKSTMSHKSSTLPLLSLDMKTINTVNPSIEQRLISMLNGDREAANRLVAREKVRYAGKTEQWYWETAIERLIRDRQ